MSDSGVGMDRETRRHVFDPFFTTKEIGKGTGLGLATVHGIVEQSGGHIVVDSQPDHGSRFKIYLPRASVEAQVDRVAAPEAVGPGLLPVGPPSAAKILVAEDHPLVRSVLARILGDLGYDVLLSEDGEQALELARGHAGEIELLVTDVIMGGMGGLELAKRLAVERPRLRVLFISGYSWDTLLPASDPSDGVDFLQKPFSPDELASKVARLISFTRGGGGGDRSSQRDDAGTIEVQEQRSRGNQ